MMISGEGDLTVLNGLNMACRISAILKPDTDLYESYLAPRVAAVQSERRPTAIAAAQAAAAAAAAANEGLTNGGRSKEITGLYGMYDSPTMLPRTPIAPGEFSQNHILSLLI